MNAYQRKWIDNARLTGKCTNCGKPKENDRQEKWHCQMCASKHSSYSATKAKQWKARGLCQRCGKPKAKERKNRATCEKCAKYEREQKQKFLLSLGGKCACCGENRYEFLSIHHVHGGGSKKRLEEKNHNRKIIGRLNRGKEPKENYQVLCMNCNTALGFYGYCPHNTFGDV
jgi:hypothetical protein